MLDRERGIASEGRGACGHDPDTRLAHGKVEVVTTRGIPCCGKDLHGHRDVREGEGKQGRTSIVIEEGAHGGRGLVPLAGGEEGLGS